MQEWFWTPEWQAAEQEAESDIECGRVYDFNSVDEALAAFKLPKIADTMAADPDPMRVNIPKSCRKAGLKH